MRKLNYGYVDFVDHFLQRTEDDLTTELSRKDYEIANNIGKNRSIYRLYFEAPFQTFLDAGKDAADTIKPYKRFGQFGRDLAQPLFGFANLLRGIANIAGSAISFIPVMLFIFCSLAAMAT